ncbi:carboxypeptidase regulatory-like domain-containing protein [Microbacterium sp. B19]|uniref:carboxypeptidase regulatory-like domain-containing protein n=1 Tax=Microbacterium sp. B19 TaxID=96765 RepID=UPI0003B5CB19|nr:carboxypeptidase regulatory-like domain-containing protein [Microbacterium sp. B19]
MTLPAGRSLTAGLVTATVYASGGSIAAAVPVAADGTYRAAGLDADVYTVKFSASPEANLLPQWWDAKTSSSWATPITLVGAQQVSGINASLQAGASLSGRVQIPSGATEKAVQVAAYSTSDESVAVGASSIDVTGRYVIRGLPAGSYLVRFSPWDSSLLPQWWKDAAVIGSATSVTLARGEARDGIDATIRTGATVSGRISAPAGTDLASVSVSVYDVARPEVAVTSTTARSDGTFSIAGLPTGAYKLLFGGAAGIVPEWWRDAPDFASATALNLVAGSTAKDVNPTLSALGSISGSVTAPAGVDLSTGGVTILAFRTSDPTTAVARTTIRRDGTYTLAGLAADSYRVSFSPGALPLVSEWWNDSPDFDSATTITLSAGQRVTGIDAALASMAGIVGRVTLPSGVDIRSGQIAVRAFSTSDRTSAVAQTTVAPDGSYALSGLRAGSYAISFTPKDLPVLAEWWNDKPDFDTATPVVVRTGQTVKDVNVVLARSATISGTVTLPAGVSATAGNVTIRAWSSAAVIAATAVAGPDGRYTITGLPPGTYRVDFDPGTLPAVAQWWNAATTYDTATAVTVKTGQSRDGVNAVLRPLASISGKVTVPAGVTPTPGDLTVTVVGADGYPLTRAVDVASDGTYTVTGLPTARYKIRFSARTSPLLEQWWDNKPDADSAIPLALAAGEARTGVDATMSRAGSISGKVSLPTGVALSSGAVEVSAFAAGGTDAAASSFAAADGTYSITGLRAGTYTVLFHAHDLPVVDQWWKKAADRASATSVTVTAGQARTQVDAALTAGASIRGRVSLPSGIDLSSGSATAEVFNSSAPGSLVASAPVASDGTFQVIGLAGGSYKIHIAVSGIPVADRWWNDKPDFASATELVLTPGQASGPLAIPLAPLASISGKVALPSGASVDPTTLRVELYSTFSSDRVLASAAVRRDGTYSLTGLAAGTYKVKFATFNAPLLEQWWKGRADFSTATLLTIKTGEARTGIDATLSSGASIAGTVSFPDGSSTVVTSPRVEVYSIGDAHTVVKDASVAASGSYVVAGLAPGTYRVRFTGSHGVDEWWKGAATADAAQAIPLTAGQAKTGVDGTLRAEPPRTSGVVGRVALPDGVTLDRGHITVWVFDTTKALIASGNVRADGTYSILDLPAGTYTIEFDSSNLPVAERWWWESASTAESARALTLAVGQVRTGINTTPPRGARISGTVTLPTGVSLAAAPVTVYVESSTVKYTSVASTQVLADGSYQLHDVPPGSYKLEFHSGSTRTVTQWWNARPNWDTADVLTVTAGQVLTGIDAKLAKSASVSGRVTLPAGIRLSDGTVEVQALSTSPSDTELHTTVVQSDGSYLLAGLPAGSYRISFTPRDLPVLPQWWDHATDYGSAAIVTLTAGQVKTGVDAALASGGIVSGRVSAPADLASALSGTMVELRPTSGSLDGNWMTTVRADGTYTISGVTPGTYNVSFVPQNRALLPEFWKDARTVQSATPITVTGGGVLTGIDASLEPAATISGKVTLPPGVNPGWRSLEVKVVPATSEWDSATYGTVASDGTYSVGGLVPGSYKVKFQTYDIDAVSEWWNDKPDFASATAITVQARENKKNIDATLARSASISGTVSLPSGVTLGQGRVQVSAYAPGNSWQTLANAYVAGDGSYTLTGLPAGTYVVKFTPNGLPVTSEWWDDKADISTATRIVLASGQKKTGVDAALSSSPTISGKVTLPKGVSLSQGSVSVEAYAAAESWSVKATAQVSEDGSYTLSDLAPGSYKIKFSSSWLPVVSQWWNAQPDFASATTVALGAGGRVTGIDATLTLAASISGTITLPSTATTGSLTVSAVSDTDRWKTVASTTVSGNGSYTLTGLPAGSYRVQFSTYSLPVLDEWWDDAASFDDARTITLTAGQKRTGVNASLAAAGSISGTVSGPGGVPAAGVSIVAYIRTADGSWTWRDQTSTNDRGTFTISRLAPGSYTLQADPPSGSLLAEYFSDKPSLATADVITVDSGSRREVTANMTLASGTKVSGKATYADGSPVSSSAVHLYSRSGATLGWTQTDANGAYSFPGVAPGEVTTAVDAAGGRVFSGSAAALAAATFVTVAAKPVTLDLRVAGVTVSGTVAVSGRTTPATGGTVRVASPLGGYSPSVRVASDGRFSVRGVMPGSYTLSFQPSEDSDLAPAWSDAASNFADAVAFTVGATPVIKNITTSVAGAITGTLPTPPGESYVSLELLQMIGGEARSVDYTYGAAGSAFRFGALAPGQYTVSAGPIFLGGAVTPESARWVTVAGSATDVGTPDVTPKVAAGTVSVTVLGQGPASTTVALIDAAGRTFSPSVTSSSSSPSSLSATFYVPTGTYRAFAGSRAAGGVDTWFGGSSATTATKISVKQGRTTPVSFTMATGDGSVSGSLTDAKTGTPVAGAVVRLVPLDRSAAFGEDASRSLGEIRVSSAKNGSFSLPSSVVAGKSYRIDVATGGPSDNALVSQTFTAVAGSQVKKIAVPAPGTVTGTVVDARSGQPVSGEMVLLWRDGDTAAMRGASTDETGAYSFTGLPTGSYRVQFHGEVDGGITSYAPGWAPSALTRESAPSFVVSAGGTTTIPTRKLDRAGVLTGRLSLAVSSTTTRWASGYVEARDAKGAVVASTYADAWDSGGFSLEVPAGTFTVCSRLLSARPTDAGTCRSGVAVTAGAVVAGVDLTSKPAQVTAGAAATASRMRAAA